MPPTASWLHNLGSQARALFQKLHRAVAAAGGVPALAAGMTGADRHHRTRGQLSTARQPVFGHGL